MCISSANDAKSLELFKSSLRYQKVKMVNIILEIFCVSTLERSIHFHLAFLSSSTFLKVEKKKKNDDNYNERSHCNPLSNYFFLKKNAVEIK